ncbi:MAG: antitoxin family protein [Chloroflexota bacterium]
MVKTIEALFDGVVFRPVEPITLKPNTRVRITIETPRLAREKQSFLRVASSLKLEGPPDWSTNLEEYLYGKGEREG